VTNNTDFLNDYYDFLKESKNTDNTAASYHTNVTRFFSDIQKSPDEILQNDIVDYINQKKSSLKPSTLRLMKASIKDFLTFMESDIKFDVHIKRSQIEAQPIPSEQDFKKIFFYAGLKSGYEGLRNQTILSVLYHTGLRIDEARSLEIEDIDFDEKYIYVFGKGAKRRAVPINDTLYSALVEYLKIRFLMSGSNALFLSAGKNHKGAIISYGAFRKIIKEACRLAGYSNLSPYCFRHSFCTKLIKSGASLSVIACLMGHSDTSSIACYYVPDNLDGREAVKALNF
jgi:integrase/recombinase XerD